MLAVRHLLTQALFNSRYEIFMCRKNKVETRKIARANEAYCRLFLRDFYYVT